jgi:hypothetical protein
MAIANQPTRLLISADDADIASPGTFTCILPEAITGATAVDLARASIPNTQYPIPTYQNKFYFRLSESPSTVQTLTLTNNRYFGNIPDLILQLNNDAVAQGFAITFSYNSTTTRVSVARNTPGTFLSIEPSSGWPTQFALNTRLGFQNSGFPTLAGSYTATILPNLIRTRVIYVLCDAVLNNTFSTDGLRTAIAKIPVNSIYGGLTLYAPPELSFCLIGAEALREVSIQLLDENYQAYPVQPEEISELELVFKYD